MSEEAYPEAAAILRDAGWAPHDTWQVYTRDTLVMGFQPDGLGFHVKNWAKVQPGERSYSEDTPDTPEEAAAWLVERFKAPEPETNPLSLESLEFRSEGVESLEDESNGETGEETESGSSASDASAEAGVREGATPDEAGEDLSPPREALESDPLDADFTEGSDLGSELLDEGQAELPALDAPPPEDFAPDEIAPEDPSGAFIFGDNLAHDRIVRIGQLAEYANTLIDAARVGYDENEHNTARAHVVTNMNEAGAYIGGNQALFERFVELDTINSRVRNIEAYRDARQDFIRTAGHEDVAAFDPEFGWP